jgi:hypothetical protein
LTGISLWGLLGGSDTTTSITTAAGTTKNYDSIVTFNPAGANTNPNFDLRYYVVGAGSSVTAVSLGQIHPNFVGVRPASTIRRIQGNRRGTPFRASARHSQRSVG